MRGKTYEFDYNSKHYLCLADAMRKNKASAATIKKGWKNVKVVPLTKHRKITIAPPQEPKRVDVKVDKLTLSDRKKIDNILAEKRDRDELKEVWE